MKDNISKINLLTEMTLKLAKSQKKKRKNRSKVFSLTKTSKS